MPNQITWTTVILVLGPALVAALATLAGSWLSNHFQLKNKKLDFGVDPQSLTTKDIEALTFKLARAHDIETRILTALVTKKREDLFAEYLGTTRSLRKK